MNPMSSVNSFNSKEKKTRYDKRFLGREDNKTKITTNRGNENSLSLFSSSFVSMSKEKMMKEEKGRERHLMARKKTRKGHHDSSSYWM